MLVMELQLLCRLTQPWSNTFQKAAKDLIKIDRKLSAVEIHASSKNNPVIQTILFFFFFWRWCMHVCVAAANSISCPSFGDNCLTNETNPFFTVHSGQKSESDSRVVAAAFPCIDRVWDTKAFCLYLYGKFKRTTKIRAGLSHWWICPI